MKWIILIHCCSVPPQGIRKETFREQCIEWITVKEVKCSQSAHLCFILQKRNVKTAAGGENQHLDWCWSLTHGSTYLKGQFKVWLLFWVPVIVGLCMNMSVIPACWFQRFQPYGQIKADSRHCSHICTAVVVKRDTVQIYRQPDRCVSVYYCTNSAINVCIRVWFKRSS